MVTVSRFDELGEGMRDGEATWLRGPTAEAFGAPRGLAVLAVPMLAAGESLGALLLVLDEREELGATRARLLRAIATQLAFALLRERLAGDLFDASVSTGSSGDERRRAAAPG
jgi:GAF domain-containing protein